MTKHFDPSLQQAELNGREVGDFQMGKIISRSLEGPMFSGGLEAFHVCRQGRAVVTSKAISLANLFYTPASCEDFVGERHGAPEIYGDAS